MYPSENSDQTMHPRSLMSSLGNVLIGKDPLRQTSKTLSDPSLCWALIFDGTFYHNGLPLYFEWNAKLNSGLKSKIKKKKKKNFLHLLSLYIYFCIFCRRQYEELLIVPYCDILAAVVLRLFFLLSRKCCQV